MVDIETLSTASNACILTIGAIRFDRYTEISKVDIVETLKKMDVFYCKIDIGSCEELGLKMDVDTLKWWMKQSTEAIEEAFFGERMALKDVLLAFTQWFKGSDYIWSHGDDFDTVILGEAYRKCGLQSPWKYWNTRDTRTLFDVAKVTKEMMPNENLHNAVFDCYRQILGVALAFKMLSS